MKQSSVLYVSLVILSCGMGLTAACSDDTEPSECTGDDCGGATVGGGGGSKATGGTKAVAGATSTTRGGSSATGGSSTSGGASTAAGGASVVGGASATGGTSAATGGTSAATGGTTAATGGTTAATGGTKAVGGTTAAGGATTAVAGSTSLGGASNIAGNAGTTHSYGLAGAAGAAVQGGTNLAKNAIWSGAAGAPSAGYPRVYASSQKLTENTPANLFDESGSIWVSATAPNPAAPEIVAIEFETPKLISAVLMKGRMRQGGAYNPSDYTIETSDTGADGSWIVRATLTRADTWAITETPATNPILNVLATPVTAKWIRLRITDTWYIGPMSAPNSTQLAELEIY